MEPPLPSNIEEILSSSCPFWPGMRVYETHLLTLIPDRVNGVPLNLESLEGLVKNPRRGNSTQYQYINFSLGEAGDPASPAAHWALMTRKGIPGTGGESFQRQQEIVVSLGQKVGATYELPLRLDAVVSILMEHVRTGSYLFSVEKPTWTRCQEKWNEDYYTTVGGFSERGLNISYNYDERNNGAAAVRRFL